MKPTLALALACVAALAAAPALADSKGNGKPNKGHGHVATACPPGLAKKSPACVPPGQAMKAYRNDDRPILFRIDDRDYRLGDRLIDPGYHLVTRPSLYGLDPLDDGSRYVIAGNKLLRVDGDTLELLALVRLVDAVLD